MKFFTWKAVVIWLVLPLFYSCASYNRSMQHYYASVQAHDYEKALRKLGNNKFMKKSRNQLLYNMEAGNMLRFKNQYEESNRYFNAADDQVEIYRKSAGDLIAGNLVNPMQQAYRAEDFEKFMLHYYKALNYAALGKQDDALVEARRISLSANSQEDKYRNKENRYSSDAFALNLQGILYEMGGDINNAFIAYRNAADIYLHHGGTYYGVPIPTQLKTDLLRTATIMGFKSEAAEYEKMFPAVSKDQTVAAELVLFLEEGFAPVKQEKNFLLTSVGGRPGNFSFIGPDGYDQNIAFDYEACHISSSRLSEVRAVRIAMPSYLVTYPAPVRSSIQLNGTTYSPQLAEDINSLAVNTLKERFLAEMANALTRQLSKKLLEKGTQAAAKGIAESSRKKDREGATEQEKENNKKKNEANAQAAGEIAGFVMNLVNTGTEKADTRNWQSLPAFISYVRIPLQEGENNISIDVNGTTRNIKVQGRKGIQLMGIPIN